MPRRDPSHRWVVVARAEECPEHATEAALWRSLHGGPECDASHALEIYAGGGRAAMQGWILTKAPDEDISRRTGVPLGVITAYRHLFFDVNVFRHHLDMIDWIKAYSDDSAATAEGSQYLRWAVMYGSEAIAWMSGLPASLDPTDVQRQSMIDSHFRSLMGRDAPIDSGVAREGLKHRQVALAQAEKLAKSAPPSAKDFAVKLRHRELTSKIEVVDKTEGEVIH